MIRAATAITTVRHRMLDSIIERIIPGGVRNQFSGVNGLRTSGLA
jgi:hypothetical protein